MTDPAASRSVPVRASEAVGQRSGEAASSDAADRAQFVQRVARAFESAADRGGHVRLRLYPPELGSLRLDLTVRSGVLNARMETDTESARNMLLENLPALKERLSGHHIQVERFDIEWRGQPQGGLPQRSGDPDRWQPPPARAARVGGAVPAGSASDAAGIARRINPGTSFDVLI
jgi:flagellar hook-length control protein FliK